MVNLNSKKVLKSIFWMLLERSGSQTVQFIVQIILARLLLPEDYGIIAVVIVFIHIADIFIQTGLNTALIQKKQADQLDFSSSFYFNLFLSVLLYLLLFIAAPFISEFYKIQEITVVLRLLSLSIFAGAFISIQKAYASRNMMFKLFFVSSVGSSLLSGIVGVLMALNGFGVWALVFQQLTSQFSNAIILWCVIKWRPILQFSVKRMKILFSFGWKILVSSLFDVLEKDLRSLIIGRIYSPSTLGFYNRGQSFPLLIVGNVNSSIQNVMLPVLSTHQDDVSRIKEMVRRAIVTSSYLILPMMFGMAVVAEPLVIIVLTEKWIPVVPFMQIACITYALWPIHTANLQAIMAMGRSDIYLKLEIVKKTIGLIILIISIPLGVHALAMGLLITGFISSIINAFPNKKLINYSYSEQLKDILPSLILSIVMAIGIHLFSFLNLDYLVIFFIQIIFGILFYFGLSSLINIEAFVYLKKTVYGIFRERKRE